MRLLEILGEARVDIFFHKCINAFVVMVLRHRVNQINDSVRKIKFVQHKSAIDQEQL